MEELSAGERCLGELLERSHRAAPDELARDVDTAARHLGVHGAEVYLVDYEQQTLRSLTRASAPTELSVDATLAGRAFRNVEVQVGAAAEDDSDSSSGSGSDSGSGADKSTDEEQRRCLWLPILDGVERLGVLAVTLPASLADHPLTVQRCQHLAALVAELLLSKSLYGDALQLVSRRRPMSLPAEMQWQSLPPLTGGSRRVTVSGMVEPCYDVGGDAFDYALAQHDLHFAVFDAMGHGLEASLLSTVAIAAYRHARRSGLDVTETAEAIDVALGKQFGGERFVTAILAELDLVTGQLWWVSAGHPAPLLLRGNRVVKTLEVQPRTPLGLGNHAVEVGSETLEPGDRLALYTDGIVEARDAAGEFFGLERLQEFLVREAAGGLPLPETMRRLRNAVLAHQHGQLQDDASQLLLEWHPDGSLPRG